VGWCADGLTEGLEGLQGGEERNAGGRSRGCRMDGRCRRGREGDERRGRRPEGRGNDGRASAILVAAVTHDQIAVVTFLDAIPDTVTAMRKSAVGAAERIGLIAVQRGTITFLTEVGDTVAAGTERELAIGGTAVGKGGIDERGLALLAEGTLNDAITADAPFEVTVRGAAVEITTIAVVAFLGWFDDTVAAVGLIAPDKERFEAATTVATVGIGEVAVIALFIFFFEPVAAGRSGGEGLLPPAEGGAAVAIGQIAVVTLLSGINRLVAAAVETLPLAPGVAAVTVTLGPVITVFREFDDVVAATFEVFPSAEHGAAVTIGEVAIVALFTDIEEPVTAFGA